MTPKQQKFCRHYAELQNAAEAAREAGYSESYSKFSARRLLNKPEIVYEIKRIRGELVERADKTAVDVVNELATWAFDDRGEWLKDDPMYPGQKMYKEPQELTREQRACVERIYIHNHFREDDEGRRFVRQTFSYRLISKEKAMESMGRHFGIFDDRIRLTTGGENPFANLPTEKLSEIKKAVAAVMAKPVNVYEGESNEQREDD